jgi:hypothetical protein
MHKEMQHMRMKLFEVEIIHTDGSNWATIVAPSEERAVEFVHEHYRETGEDFTRVLICQIDDTLEPHERLGLDEMLETAPVAFSSYCPPIGWLAHAAAVHNLRFFKIEEHEGPETFVIAPNADVASAVWGESIMPLDGEPRLFRVMDGMAGLSSHQKELLAAKLEFGPIGVATWNEDEGWMVRPPA